jgi:hypothetical protein
MWRVDIPKGVKRELVGWWHPITILNVSYKILAKTLPRRIQLLAAKIVCKEKTSFNKGRFILDNRVIA